MMCTQYVVFLVLCALGSCSFIVDNKDTLVDDNITANVISIFTEHNILFHYDNTSRDLIDSLINKIVYCDCILMVNYDVYQQNNDTTNKSIHFIRPIGHKFLHVVMLSNYSIFEKYSTSSIFSFEYLDIVLVIKTFDGNETDFDIFIENVNRAGSFFLFNVSNFVLYSNCYYCGERAYIWEFVANLSNATNADFFLAKLLVRNIYHNQFTNFSGHVFTVGYTNYKPFFWCEFKHEKNESWIDVFGSEGGLIFTLQDKLNINFQMIEITNLENVWFSITEAVRNGTFDWVIGGITFSASRSKIVEFTNTINFESFVVLYSLFDNVWLSWMTLLGPFEFYVWAALFATVLTIATILFVIAHTIKPKPKRKFKFLHFIEGVLRYLVEQPLPIIKNFTKTRWVVILIMSLWLLVAQIMTNVYKSKITSSFINLKGTEYKHSNDLLHSNFHFYIHEFDEHMVKESLEMSNDSDYLEILKRSKIFKHFCNQVSHLNKNKKAIIGQETIIQFVVRKYCLPQIPTKQVENLRLIKKALFPCSQSWPIAQNIPYLASLNTVIARLNAAGIINKWNNDYSLNAKTVLKGHEKRLKHDHPHRNKFTIRSISGPIFLWLVGIIVAILAFLNELRLGKHICSF